MMDISSRQLITLMLTTGITPSQLVHDMAAHYHRRAQAIDQNNATPTVMAMYHRLVEMEKACKEAAQRLVDSKI